MNPFDWGLVAVMAALLLIMVAPVSVLRWLTRDK